MTMDSETVSLNTLLARVCRLHYARAHTLLDALGLHRGQPPVLSALWEQEGLTHTDLAGRLLVRPATMTKMIRRMERAGFVECRGDAADQRVSRVFLTDTGRAIRGDLERVWQTLDAETFADMLVAERDALLSLLLRVYDNLVRADEDRRRG